MQEVCDPQNQSLFFSHTPLETRFQIYEYLIQLWGFERLHVVPRVFEMDTHEYLNFEGPFCYVPCKMPLESSEEPTLTRTKHTRGCDIWKRSQDDFYAKRGSTNPTFLQTCRRL
jgi:hypothetical protein